MPCAAHLAETGQEHTTGRLVGASVGSAQPQGPSVGMDPSGGNSSRSYRLGNTSEEKNAVSLPKAGATGESH